ncbi:unnamed protein product [Brassica napus]|uniref:(rape) hypothetical protein n=1 Tax=Brassica napus TaxID=3708 RepID=A0A816J4B1_BRANA|nr:unnamed protein product [Brassica napus]
MLFSSGCMSQYLVLGMNMGTILRVTKFLFSLGQDLVAVYSGVSFMKKRKKFTRRCVSDISLLRQKRTYILNGMITRLMMIFIT